MGGTLRIDSVISAAGYKVLDRLGLEGSPPWVETADGHSIRRSLARQSWGVDGLGLRLLDYQKDVPAFLPDSYTLSSEDELANLATA